MASTTGHEAAPRVSVEEARVLARVAQLDLPPERLEALAKSYSDFLTGFAKIRPIATGDREPPTLTHAEEGNG